MHCQGKCQLYKKLKSEHQKEEQFPESRARNKIDVLCYKTEVAIPILSSVEIPSLHFPCYVQSFPVAATLDIFHPPA